MGELLYFKNCEERKKAEELLKKYWPEASFVVMRLDMQNTIEEERVHFGKWDIEFKKNILLATITRDRKIEFPGGNSYFQPGDRVIVVSNGSMPNIQLNDIFEEDKEEKDEL